MTNTNDRQEAFDLWSEQHGEEPIFPLQVWEAACQWQSQQAQGEVVAYYDPRPGVDWEYRFLEPDVIEQEDNRKFYTVPLIANQPVPAAVSDFDKKLFDSECRESVAEALGFQRGGDYAWSYLLAQIKEAVAATDMLTASPTPDHAADVRKMVASDVSELAKAAQKLWCESYSCESDFIQAVVDAFSKQEEEEPVVQQHYPCGCVTCICEDDVQPQGDKGEEPMSNKCECQSWCTADDLGFIPNHHPKCGRFNDSLIDVAVIEVGGSKCYDRNINSMHSWSEQMKSDGEEHKFSVTKMHREQLEQMPEFDGF